jgi:transcriptional regulator with XRE-family HTH domain
VVSRGYSVRINSISRIEQDKASARPSTIRKLAEALGVEPREFTGTGK